MTRLQSALAGVVLGLITPALVLTIAWFGLAWGIAIGQVDVTDYLWPTNKMILIGWHTTPRGVATTFLSVAINCVLYAAAALLVHSVILWIKKLVLLRNRLG